MSKLLVLLFSLMLSLSSYGAWTKLIEDGDGDSYYIDFDTIEEKNGYVYWWQMRDYLKPSKGNKIVKTLTKGDCGISRSSGVSYIFYKPPMIGGEKDLYNPIKPEWDYLVSGSVAKKLLDVSCKLAELSKEEGYESLLAKIKAESERIQQEKKTKKEPESAIVVEERSDRYKTLRSAYVNDVISKVKENWDYQGTTDESWSCEVYILQKDNGEVIAGEAQNCNVGDIRRTTAFKNSIESAVYKSSPLPLPADNAVFDYEISFIFSMSNDETNEIVVESYNYFYNLLTD
jgi:hypothetical protein